MSQDLDFVAKGTFGILPGDMITCPECKTESSETEWEEIEVLCRDCGSHFAISCPICGKEFDGVWDKEEFEGKIRHPQNR